MALRDIVEGECGGPNSLIQLTSHFTKDHGLKDEGAVPFKQDNEDQLVKQFLEETIAYPQTFKMGNLLNEMQEINQSMYQSGPTPDVVHEFINHDTAWANEYLQSGGHFKDNHADDIWNPPIVDTSMDATGEGKVLFSQEQTSELGLGPKWAEEYLEQSFDTSDAMDEANPKLDSKLMKFMSRKGNPLLDTRLVVKTDDLHDNWISELTDENNIESSPVPKLERFGRSNDGTQNSFNAIDEEVEVMGTWVDEYMKENPRTGHENYGASFWERLQDEWKKLSTAELVSSSHPWVSEYQNVYDPFKEYSFNEDNPMHNVSNALNKGKNRLAQGDLVGAVLCFEAAAKQEPKNAECWLLLGKTLAENEQDPLAISALKQCLTLDPGNLTALMSLAVSYTNESYQSQACLVLKDWLFKNHKYHHLKSSNTTKDSASRRFDVSTVLFNDLHSEVKELFIQAARMQPHGTIDADVQNGLGILFNLSSEYNKAADCFKAALLVKPKDPMLWNRLGAILANSQHSEEAINAYHKALDLSPGLIRARYNLGISCMNLNCYKEAGEHFLTALNQQATAKDAFGEKNAPRIMSNTIWSTLRLVLSFLHKYDLSEAIENRDLRRLNEEFGIE